MIGDDKAWDRSVAALHADFMDKRDKWLSEELIRIMNGESETTETDPEPGKSRLVRCYCTSGGSIIRREAGEAWAESMNRLRPKVRHWVEDVEE